MELLFSGIISWCQGGVGVEVLAFDGCFEILPFMKAKHFALMKSKKISFHESKTLPEMKAVFPPVSLHQCSRFGTKSTNTKRRVNRNTGSWETRGGA